MQGNMASAATAQIDFLLCWIHKHFVLQILTYYYVKLRFVLCNSQWRLRCVYQHVVLSWLTGRAVDVGHGSSHTGRCAS